MKNKKVLWMSYIAMFIALEVAMEFVNRAMPGMPFGGNISFSLIAIFLASYLLGVKGGIIVGVGSSIILFAVGIATFWGWWSVALDYLIPFGVCGLAAVIKNIRLKNGWELPIGIGFAMVLKFLSHYFSGVFLFYQNTPAGMSKYWYSFIYNLPYNLATLAVCFVLVMVLLPKLKKVVKL